VISLNMIFIFTCFILISSVFTIRAKYFGPIYHIYIFKPSTTILILLIAFIPMLSTISTYQLWILSGLLFSLVGDIFLMFHKRWFVHGLISFLIAHLLYIGAFISGGGFHCHFWIMFPMLIYCASVFIVLYPYLGRLKIPVMLYVIVIGVMVWQAWERWADIGMSKALMAAVGASLFCISDSVLAFNKFRRRFKLAELMILSSYFSGQWLIALSVG
jgi:uncharacterized membrane protein YhhN